MFSRYMTLSRLGLSTVLYLDSHWFRRIFLLSVASFCGSRALYEIRTVLSFLRFALEGLQRHQEEQLREMAEQMPEDVRMRMREGRAERERRIEERLERRFRIF